MVRTELKMAILHLDKIEEYERLHNEIPEQNKKHIRESGYKRLEIFRQGTQLLMYLEWDSTAEIPNREIDEEAEKQWHQQTGACFAKIWEDVPMIFNFTVANKESLL